MWFSFLFLRKLGGEKSSFIKAQQENSFQKLYSCKWCKCHTLNMSFMSYFQHTGIHEHNIVLCRYTNHPLFYLSYQKFCFYIIICIHLPYFYCLRTVSLYYLCLFLQNIKINDTHKCIITSTSHHIIFSLVVFNGTEKLHFYEETKISTGNCWFKSLSFI